MLNDEMYVYTDCFQTVCSSHFKDFGWLSQPLDFTVHTKDTDKTKSQWSLKNVKSSRGNNM